MRVLHKCRRVLHQHMGLLGYIATQFNQTIHGNFTKCPLFLSIQILRYIVHFFWTNRCVLISGTLKDTICDGITWFSIVHAHFFCQLQFMLIWQHVSKDYRNNPLLVTPTVLSILSFQCTCGFHLPPVSTTTLVYKTKHKFADGSPIL